MNGPGSRSSICPAHPLSAGADARVGIPETQFPADIMVKLAIAGMDRDPRQVLLLVEAGGVVVPRVLTWPTNNPTPNIVEVLLEDVPAGTTTVYIDLESPAVGPDHKHGGDSTAVAGATAKHACEAEGGNR